MVYCKIIHGNDIVDVGTMFVYWVNKNHILAYCDANAAELIQSSLDESKLYHAEWFRKPPAEAPEYEEAEVAVIDKDEYDELRELLSEGEKVEIMVEPEPELEPEPEPVEEQTEKPMTVQQMRDKIAELEGTIAKILQTIE